MTTIHFLKSTPEAYRKVASGEKTLEVRKDDRTPRFETGDIVVLEHYRPLGEHVSPEAGVWTYQGDHDTRRIGYVERGPHVPPGYCAFALHPAEDGDDALTEQYLVKADGECGRRRRFRFEVSQ